MSVTIDDRFVVSIQKDGAVIWQGRKIGRVWKGVRTYSPPLYRGSRVAKYHKQVPCWYATAIGEAQRTYPRNTRREAIRWMIERAQEGEVTALTERTE